jgi:hypothetical protein
MPHQPFDHVAAHAAESNHRELHCYLLVRRLVVRCCPQQNVVTRKLVMLSVAKDLLF